MARMTKEQMYERITVLESWVRDLRETIEHMAKRSRELRYDRDRAETVCALMGNHKMNYYDGMDALRDIARIREERRLRRAS